MNALRKIALLGMILSTVACGSMEGEIPTSENTMLVTEASQIVCSHSAFTQDTDQNGVSDICQKEATSADPEQVHQ